MAKRKALSKTEYESAKSIANLVRSIMTEVESFVNQIILDNNPKEITDNLFLKVNIPYHSMLVNIMLLNVRTNTLVNYDIEVFELLQICLSNSLDTLMNEKVPQMVEKSEQYDKAKEVRTVYLNHSI